MSEVKSDIDEVYARLKEMSGKDLYSDEFALSPTDIRKYCIATRVSRPEHVDKQAAIKAGFPDVTAPPSIFGALTMIKLYDKSELQEDGVSAYLPLGNLGSVVGEMELEFHDFVVAGEQIRLRRTIDDVQLKTGRSGRMIMMWHQARFTGADGKLKAILKFVQVSR